MIEIISALDQNGFTDTSLETRGKASRMKNLHLEDACFLQARGNLDRPDHVAAQAG
jgi:hypothetical protein